jgi:hypothetical protein
LRGFFLACVGACAVHSGAALALDFNELTEPGHWRLAVSPVAKHFRPSDEHRRVWAIGVERQRADGWLGGASYFKNSFGQPSAYVYMGYHSPSLLGQPELFWQASAGVLYGYVGRYKSKVPLNWNGFAPGALVSVGWQFHKKSSAQLHLLGDAGVMLQLSYDLQ